MCYILFVEKECTKCHKVFRATQESQEICAECLGAEFGSGVVATDFGRDSVVKSNTDAMRRQQARADRVGKQLRSSSAFSTMGQVRCGLAVLLFLICVFMFIISDGEHMTFLNQLEYNYQLSISVGVSLVASLLLLPSFSGHKVTIGISWAIMLIMGVNMPNMWHYRVPQTTIYSHNEEEKDVADIAASIKGRLLTDKELSYFYDLKKTRPRAVHYSVFVRCDAIQEDYAAGVVSFGKMEQKNRNLIRSSLSRMLHGAQVEINNTASGSGVIFTVVNVPDERKNLTTMLGCYGRVYFSDAAEGIYELLLEPDKVSIGEELDTSVLLDPAHPGFAELNMRALRSLNAEIVRAAAKRLADANVNRLRSDICSRLIETLQYPWEAEPDAYNALVEALVVYAPAGEARTIDLLWHYFKENIRNRRGVSNIVVTRLAKDAPERMKDPVLKLWQANPTAWNDIAGILAAELEPVILEQLSKSASDVKVMTDCLNYLEPYGTQKAIPVLEAYVNHQDRAIARKAANTIDAIRGRQQQ